MKERKIKHVPKREVKPQQSPDYKIQRHAAGLIKAFAQKYPNEFKQIVQEVSPKPA
jgi:hypothetical protein